MAAGFADGGDFILHEGRLTGEERAAVDDHVDLVGAIGHGGADFGEPCGERGLARGEGGGDRGDFDGGAAEVLLRVADEGGVDADGGCWRDG